ncbi:MAG: Rieske 2Fe-2S domain-containing protein [Ardenticatenaceae bacterium]
MLKLSEKLFHCWHAVAYSDKVKPGEPYATMLLSEPVVIWRTADGKPHAMKDLCIHRGTALSLGWVKDDCIVCPYHGWRYNADGACVRIPQNARTSIPRKARTVTYRCQERYGLIWVAMADPVYELPEVPELENPKWKVVNTGPYTWNSDASRQIENFTDFGHFAWVHPGLLGDPERPLVTDYEVEVKGHVLHYTIVRPEAGNTDDFPIFAHQEMVAPSRNCRYQLHLPYSLVLRVDWGGEKSILYLFVSQPISENKCQGYCIVGRNYDLDQPDSVMQDFEDVIFEQDRRIVESQRPHQVPFDLADELHLKFDNVAINYRRTMHTEGLDYYAYLDVVDA